MNQTSDSASGWECPACGLFSPDKPNEIFHAAVDVNCAKGGGGAMVQGERTVYLDDKGGRLTLNPIEKVFERLPDL
jgi:hypothetical protein